MSLPNYLEMFCQHLVQKYDNPQNVTEEEKAAEFRDFYLKDMPLNVRGLKVLAGFCGISTIGLDAEKMPEKLRGYHETIDGRQSIYYREEDTVSGIQNTILHEMREMMEPLFAEAYRGYRPMQTSAKHIAANKFASAVLLPGRDFLDKALETGLDVIELSRHFHKSSAQILLRLGEVLKNKVFFYGSLYGESSGKTDQWEVGYWTLSFNGKNPSLNAYGAGLFFPRKGKVAETGTIIDMSAQKGNSFVVKYNITRKNKPSFNLVNLAQPMILDQKVNGVFQIIVLEQNMKLLKPQIERIIPIILDTENFNL